MSSPKHSITSHSSYLWREPIVCFCLLSNPFSFASCPRLQTKGSVAPARSDETAPCCEPRRCPRLCSVIIKRMKETKGHARSPQTPPHQQVPEAPSGHVAPSAQDHPGASLCTRAPAPWSRCLTQPRVPSEPGFGNSISK